MKHYSDHQTGEDLLDALKKLTLLKELEIDFNYYRIGSDDTMLQSICKACPRLEELVLMYLSAFDPECNNEDEFDHMEPVDGPIPAMLMLGTLELYDRELSCEGLNAILDSSPRLETLLIHGHFDKQEMDEELKLKCARVKNLTLDTKQKTTYGDNWSDEEYYDLVDE